MPTNEQPKEGADKESESILFLDGLVAKIKVLLKRYRGLLAEDGAKAAEFGAREYESFAIANKGAFFDAAELEALGAFGVSLSGMDSLEWQEGEIKRAMKGLVC
jgi:hypothetical protein